MSKSIKVIQGNPTEEELVALSIGIQEYLAQQKQKSKSNTSNWQLANKIDRKPSPWLSSPSSPWSYSERMSEPWRD